MFPDDKKKFAIAGSVNNLNDTRRRRAVEVRLREQAQKIKELMRQLEDFNAQLKQEISRREDVENRLLEADHKCLQLTKRQIDIQETERQQLAHELHDLMGHTLAGIKLNLEVVLNGEVPDDLREQLVPLTKMVKDSMAQIHQISTSLRPPMLDDLGIEPTINWFCRQFEDRFPWIFIHHRIRIRQASVSGDTPLAIFRIIQEALTNVAKHSQTDHVDLTLQETNAGVELRVADNGVGFDPPKVFGVVTDDEETVGLGLCSMSKRAESSGGRFSLISGPGRGTEIRVQWPPAQKGD